MKKTLKKIKYRRNLGYDKITSMITITITKKFMNMMKQNLNHL